MSSLTPALTVVNGANSTVGPNIDLKIDTASSTKAGILTVTDWTTFNNKQSKITAGNVSSTTPALKVTNGASTTIGPNIDLKIDTASTTKAGILTSADWTTFNTKQNAIAAGAISSLTTAITVTNGAGSTFGPNVQIKIDTASSTKNGIILAGDWTKFNAKLDSVFVTARLSGKGTSASPLDIARQGANTGDVLKWNGTTWVPGSPVTDAWRLLGNSGTSSATNFVGTTDNVELVFRANNTVRLRLNTNGSIQRTGDGNARGDNSVDLQTVRGAVSQVASGSNSFIGSGKNNTVSADNSSIVGGSGNMVSAAYSSILVGDENSVTASHGAVVSGDENEVEDQYSVILGGHENKTNGTYNLMFGEQVEPLHHLLHIAAIYTLKVHGREYLAEIRLEGGIVGRIRQGFGTVFHGGEDLGEIHVIGSRVHLDTVQVGERMYAVAHKFGTFVLERPHQTSIGFGRQQFEQSAHAGHGNQFLILHVLCFRSAR